MDVENFNEENYIKEEHKINVFWLNIFGFIVLAIAILLFGLPFYWIWPDEFNNLLNSIKNIQTIGLQERLINTVIVFSIFLIFIVIHEFIHGIFFSVFSQYGFKSVKFGIMPAKKLFTPYCRPKEILKINHYKIAVIMPLLIMGIIPTLISFFIGKMLLLVWGIILIVLGSGDLWLFIKTSALKNNNWIFSPESKEMVGIIYRPKENIQN